MRIKRFDVSARFPKSILSPGRRDLETIENGLPEDAELVRIWVDPSQSTPAVFSLFYTSASYPELPEGSLVSPESITFRQHFHGPDDTMMLAFS